ncbi:MAG: HlyC/CorC family transporter [Sphingobacteriales bacterium]|jgi:putative hemolysin|nr:HlyC/CorC family transporter [Sphingobacteriales bacterium]
MDMILIIWILSFLFMAFFAGVEMAFFSASRLNIELRRNQGAKSGKILGKFVDSPAVFLSTTIIGFVIALTAFVLFTSQVSARVWPFLHIESRTAQIVLEIFANALIVLVFVEFIPRAVFRAHSNALLRWLAHIINFFYWLLEPITIAFFKLSDWILKYVFNVRLDKSKSPFNRSDLRFLFRDNVKEMMDDETSTQLLENAQELPNVRIRQCLVPRKEIVAIEINATIAELVLKFTETKRSRIIIYEDNIDNILGYVHELDLFKKPDAIKPIILPIPAVPESMGALNLINKFSKEGKSIAWVVDEFGGTAGIITIEDVLEELFGEIQDEYDTEVFVEKRIAEDEYIFSGRLELDYLEEKYNLNFEEYDTETLSGYIIEHFETIPTQKERIIIGNYEFDIVSVSDTRIEVVKLRRLK